MLKVVVPVKEEILKAAEYRKSMGVDEEITQFLAKLINLGFEYHLQRLYRQFEAGEISRGYFANELGMGIRDLYATLEQRELPTSNIAIKP